MDRNSLEYQLMRDKALAQLRSGESLTGKDGAFGPVSFPKLVPFKSRHYLSLQEDPSSAKA